MFLALAPQQRVTEMKAFYVAENIWKDIISF